MQQQSLGSMPKRTDVATADLMAHIVSGEGTHVNVYRRYQALSQYAFLNYAALLECSRCTKKDGFLGKHSLSYIPSLFGCSAFRKHPSPEGSCDSQI